MNEHFHLSLTLDEFARHTGRSLTAFKNEFKKISATPPKEWVNNKRLERAHNLLTNTDASASEVCYDVGFNSMSHFIRIFRNRFGVTPKKIRAL